MMKKSDVFGMLFVAVVATFFQFVTGYFFDSVDTRGFISFDVLLLTGLLCLPQKAYVRKLPLLALLVVYAWLFRNSGGILSGILFAVLALVASVIPRNRLWCTIYALCVSLFVIVCDWYNFFFSTFSMNLSDVWMLASFYWWGVIAFFAVPALQLSLMVLFGRNLISAFGKISHKKLYAFLIVVFVLNAVNGFLQQRQNVLEFTVKKMMWNVFDSGVGSRNVVLAEDVKNAYPVWDQKLDYDKPTLMILVESWGLHKNVDVNNALLSIFSGENVRFKGILRRHSAYTQGAEYEDLEKREKSPLPLRLQQKGVKTFFVHGYDGDFYNRQNDYRSLGFDTLVFSKDFATAGYEKCQYGFEGACDASVARWLDSLMSDKSPKFIYWTTLDSHPPYEGQKLSNKSTLCDDLNLKEMECVFTSRIEGTLRLIDALAQKHPEYQFVIRGDHRPMVSVLQSNFSASYYYEWVLMTVLN